MDLCPPIVRRRSYTNFTHVYIAVHQHQHQAVHSTIAACPLVKIPMNKHPQMSKSLKRGIVVLLAVGLMPAIAQAQPH